MRWLPKNKINKNPNIYLKNLTVSQRTSLKKNLDNFNIFDSPNIEKELYKVLEKIFTFPSLSSRTAPNKNDLSLDVTITSYQLGEFLLPDLLFFWRPKITLSAQLTNIDTQKPHSTYTVTEKFEWKNFGNRVLGLRALNPFKSTFDSKDMERLLYKACIKVLQRI